MSTHRLIQCKLDLVWLVSKKSLVCSRSDLPSTVYTYLVLFVRCPWFGLLLTANLQGVIPFSEIVILDLALACVFISNFILFIFFSQLVGLFHKVLIF